MNRASEIDCYFLVRQRGNNPTSLLRAFREGRRKSAPKAPKAAKRAKPGKRAKRGAKAAVKAESPRVGSKTWKILELIGRAKGATLAEIMAATEWQAHSVRGFISTAGKKHNVKIESLKNENGGRVYRIQE
jgi:hypothetical protein